MTPKQLKPKPFKEIFKKQHEKYDIEEGESNREEEESITSSEKSEQDSESDTTEDEEETKTTKTHQVHNVLNETTHDEEILSETEDDTSNENFDNEIQPYYENGEENNIYDNKLLTTNFEVKVENRKVEGLITYSTDQQIFKFKVNSGTDQEVWGVYIDFQSIHS